MDDESAGGCWFGCVQEEKHDQHKELKNLPSIDVQTTMETQWMGRGILVIWYIRPHVE